VFPELIQQQDFVGKVIKEEEDAFLRTLDKGLKKIDEEISYLKNVSGQGTDTPIKNFLLEGKVAFELFDTFGFPFDLTKLIAS
ncbi:alanine--tRNA ligase-related protein, partial [Acinetobacter baumannii]